MNFASAVKVINSLLKTIQPHTFNGSWILHNAPQVYRFIQKNIRTEIGGIDWDRITRALDRKVQRKWTASPRGRRSRSCRDKRAVEIILKKYQDKLYTFLSPVDKQDREVRDIISIALVRIAQAGNPDAKEDLVRLLRFTIDQWIEQHPRISCWQGLDDLIQKHIEGCIRRYRYSGSFIRYLFKTLEYAGRGLRPIVAYSLDDFQYSGEKRRSDRVAQDAETGEIVIYR
ncbi:MAG: hypothetical protein HZB62_11285 [Nitrospirae bacterium]|nr:hypothetical protein [Nitrospirota bacterium]